MDEILWRRRESRRQTEKTNFFLSSGSLLPTRKVCLHEGTILRLLDSSTNENGAVYYGRFVCARWV